MHKELIINEILRLASENNGKAPGIQHFQSQTGIKKGEWYPHMWLRWSDAVQEAGLLPNKLNERHDDDYILEKYALLVREIGHRAVVGEVRRKSIQDKAFPAHTVFTNRYDGITGLMSALRDFCNIHKGFSDVASLCEKDVEALDVSEKTKIESSSTKVEIAYVYLMKSGRHNKIGRTVSVEKRERDIGLIIPELPKTVHWIATDDPVGVEMYWHKRFSGKRTKGEWFLLSADDVAAFKRWKRIV